MVRLEEIVEKLFMEHPEKKSDDAIEELRKQLDPKTNKPMWHISTIRNRVESYLSRRDQQENLSAEQTSSDQQNQKSNAFSTEATTNARSELKATIEGAEILRRKQELSEHILKKSEEITPEQKPSIDLATFEKKMVSIAEGIRKGVESFGNELRADFKIDLEKTRNEFEKRIAQININAPIKEEPYDELELKVSTIDAIKEEAAMLRFDEVSDYLDELRKVFKEYTLVLESHIKPYTAILDSLKKAENNTMILKCSLKDNKLECSEYIPLEQPKRSRRHIFKVLAVGFGAGIPIGAIIMYILVALLHLPLPA